MAVALRVLRVRCVGVNPVFYAGTEIIDELCFALAHMPRKQLQVFDVCTFSFENV
jgi:hypothetical protein